MPYLFLFHVGPVQSFIASARRTRDLWFGSHLLSELSKAGAKAIVDICGIDSLIFPAPLDYADLESNSEMNVANKILARLPDQLAEKYQKEQGDKSVPCYVGEKVIKAIEARRDEIYGTMLRAVKKAANREYLEDKNYLDFEIAQNQVEDFVERYWVATYYKDDDEYATRRLELENALAARKNTRDFQPVAWGSTRSKSSIDGQYESVIPSNFYAHYKDSPEDKLAKVKRLYHIFHAGPSEQLSGIDLLKRRGSFSGKEETFLSTSHLAALPYLVRLEKDPLLNTESTLEELKKQWKAYVDNIEKLLGKDENTTATITEKIPEERKDLWHTILEDYDGALLFEQRLLEDAQNRRDDDKKIYEDAQNKNRRDKTGKEIYKDAQSNLKQFFTTVNDALGTSIAPTPYYAIIHADGDSMGKAIKYHAQQGKTRHQEFSRQLESFAQAVSGIVMKYKGAPVYSGGDDVLALLPLHTVLDCAQELEEKFSESLSDYTFTETTTGKIIKPTLSVGIAIVHHLSLLNEALDLARAAEKAAKRVPDKNGLAISLNKRSGETYTIALPWKDMKSQAATQLADNNANQSQDAEQTANDNTNQSQDTEGSTDKPYLLALIEAYSIDRLPRGSAYELRDMAQRFTLFATLATKEEKNADKLRKIYRRETWRILRRKLNLPFQPDEKESPIDAKGTEPKEKEARVQLLNQLRAHEDALFEQANSITKLQKALSEFIQEMIIAETLADAQSIATPEATK